MGLLHLNDLWLHLFWSSSEARPVLEAHRRLSQARYRALLRWPRVRHSLTTPSDRWMARLAASSASTELPRRSTDTQTHMSRGAPAAPQPGPTHASGPGPGGPPAAGPLHGAPPRPRPSAACSQSARRRTEPLWKGSRDAGKFMMFEGPNPNLASFKKHLQAFKRSDRT